MRNNEDRNVHIRVRKLHNRAHRFCQTRVRQIYSNANGDIRVGIMSPAKVKRICGYTWRRGCQSNDSVDNAECHKYVCPPSPSC